MVDWLLPILVFVAVTSLGGALLVTAALRRQPLRDRLNRPPHSATGSDLPALGQSTSTRATGGTLRAVLAPLSIGQPSSTLRRSLAQAGIHSPDAGWIFLGSKTALLAVGLAVAVLAVLPAQYGLGTKILIVVTAGVTASFIPNLLLYHRRQKRSLEIRSHLPDAIDLLEICVSAGMGLDMAWNAVADEIRQVSPTLADEMALTNLELHLGASRIDALKRLAERTGAEEMTTLVTVLSQSQRFGTSMSDALQTFAAGMRETRSMRAGEAAEKMAVKLLFPLVLFIFPTVLIVTVGPAGVILAKYFFVD